MGLSHGVTFFGTVDVENLEGSSIKTYPYPNNYVTWETNVLCHHATLRHGGSWHHHVQLRHIPEFTECFTLTTEAFENMTVGLNNGNANIAEHGKLYGLHQKYILYCRCRILAYNRCLNVK